MSRDDELLMDCFLLIFQFVDNRNKKLKIQYRITKLVKHLYGKHRVCRDEIAFHLTRLFEARGRHIKYDPDRSPLELYVAYFVYYGLLNLLSECENSKKRAIEVPLSEFLQGESVSTIGRPAEPYEEGGLEGLTNHRTPEDEIIGKELLDLASRFFVKPDLEVLLGISDRQTAAEELGLKYDSYCKHLSRKVVRFRSVITNLGYGPQ